MDLKSVIISGQPPLLWDAKLKGEQLSDSTKAGWCAYLKGAARSSMALFIAAMAMKNDWNLPILAPQLYISMQVIHCRRGILSTDLANVALENATLSRKGSLIKQHDVATWLSKLMLLRSHGLNPTQILQTRNSRSTKDAQIVGAKKVALMNLLDTSHEVVAVLLAHASEFGDRVAFSEECLSNKQILPGYVKGLQQVLEQTDGGHAGELVCYGENGGWAAQKEAPGKPRKVI